MAIIYTYPTKATPNDNDLILISDSEDSNKTKQVKISTLPGGSGSGVSSVTATLPLASTGGGTPVVSLTGLTGFGTTGQVIKVNSSADGLEWGTAAAVPAGNVYEVQYNGNGEFISSTTFTYENRVLSLGVVGDTAASSLKIYGGGSADSRLTLFCSAGTHGVTIEGPDHTGGSNYTLKLPASLPSVANQVLESNASGTLSWIPTPSGTGGSYTAGDGLQLNGTIFSTDLKENGGLAIESNELALDLGASSITGTLATSDGGTGTSNTEYCDLAANVTGILPVGKGGTGVATLGTSRLILGNGTSAVTSISSQTKGTMVVGNNTTTTILAVGTDGHVLTADSSQATGVRWTTTSVAASSISGSIDLSTQVTGTLPVGNGGIGQATLTNNGITRGQGTSGIISDNYLEYDNTNKRLNIRGSGATDPSSLGATLNIIDADGPQPGAENCIALAPAGGQGARGINIDLGSYNEGIKIVKTSGTANPAMSFMQTVSGTTQIGSISMTNIATAYNTSSDYRLKENVVEMTGSVDRVKQLKPSRFNFISEPDSNVVDGFLAHEVSSIVPEAIHGEKDAVDDQGNIIYQGIDQSKLVPLLVGAIKELTARIEALEA